MEGSWRTRAAWPPAPNQRDPRPRWRYRPPQRRRVRSAASSATPRWYWRGQPPRARGLAEPPRPLSPSWRLDAAGRTRLGSPRWRWAGPDAASHTNTNCIESMISIARDTTRNVKRWRDGTMIKRWCAAGMLKRGTQLPPAQGLPADAEVRRCARPSRGSCSTRMRCCTSRMSRLPDAPPPRGRDSKMDARDDLGTRVFERSLHEDTPDRVAAGVGSCAPGTAGEGKGADPRP